jgi:hypothetical protein
MVGAWYLRSRHELFSLVNEATNPEWSSQAITSPEDLVRELGNRSGPRRIDLATRKLDRTLCSKKNQRKILARLD